MLVKGSTIPKILSNFEHARAQNWHLMHMQPHQEHQQPVTMHNGTHLRNWQEMQEDRLRDIAEDVNILQAEGYIPNDIHEHVMITTSTVVSVVLINLSFICIRKKFGSLTEQHGNVLRSATS